MQSTTDSDDDLVSATTADWAEFRAWAASKMFPVPTPTITRPELGNGEIYVGAIGDQDGNLHHVILLPGDNDAAKWEDQKTWAASIGGDLPTRIEQSMLFKSCRDLFESDWYWSGEKHASDAGYAWYQHFDDGYQYGYCIGGELRARAVRRLPI